MNLVLLLSVHSGGGRLRLTIAEVWESEGERPHRCVYGRGCEAPPAALSAMTGSAACEAAEGTLSRLIASGARTIEEVRAFLLAHYAW